jgi:hypothetical protein
MCNRLYCTAALLNSWVDIKWWWHFRKQTFFSICHNCCYQASTWTCYLWSTRPCFHSCSFHVIDTDTLRIVYFTHFQSLINYGKIFRGSSTTTGNVFLVQKIIIRIMLGLGPRSSRRGGFKKLDIHSFIYLFSIDILQYMEIVIL